MSQLIWMIDLIPNWFWTAVLWSGIVAVVASYFLSVIPFVKQYKLPLRVCGVVGIIIGTYFFGVVANEEKWQVRVTQLEQKLAVAQEQGKKENIVIQEKIVYKDRIVKERTKKQIEYVDKVIKQREEVVKYIEHCPVPKVIIDEHNKAAGVPQ